MALAVQIHVGLLFFDSVGEYDTNMTKTHSKTRFYISLSRVVLRESNDVRATRVCIHFGSCEIVIFP